MFPGELITAVPVGIAIVLVLQGPWVVSVLRGWLVPRSQVTVILAQADARIAAADAAAQQRETAAAAATIEAKKETADWRELYKAATNRGDAAIEKLAEAGEQGRVTSKLLSTFLGQQELTP